MASTSETVTQTRTAIQKLQALLGGETWFNRAAPTRGEEEHPLVQWFRMTKDLDDPAAQRSEQFARLGRFARVVYALRSANVIELDAKIAELQASESERFVSLSHELLTAGEQLLAGHVPQFVPEGATATPDLLVDAAVEIECKVKTDINPVTKARKSVYQLLIRKLQRVMKSAGAPTGLSAAVHWRSEPTDVHAREIAQAAHSALSTQTASVRDYTSDQQCLYSLELIYSPIQRVGIPHAEPREFDLVETVGLSLPPEDGSASFSQVVTVAAKTLVPRDRVRAVRSSLVAAARQFTGTRPAVIHVDISANAWGFDDQAVGELGDMLDQFFKANTRVSAVRFDQDVVDRQANGVAIMRRSQELLNPTARLPLPLEYRYEAVIPESAAGDEAQ